MITFQYKLKAMFCIVAIFAIVAFVFSWWRWWHNTRHMRNFSSAIVNSSLDSNTKAFYEKIGWSPSAWRSGLIQNLSGPNAIKRIVWKGQTQSGKEVYIFDAFIRPAAPMPNPPICVLMDPKRNILAWEMVALFSMGFIDATLDSDDVLTITTHSNWSFSKGTYQYAIKDKSIVAIGDGKFEKYSDENQPTPKLAPQIPLIEQAVEQFKTI
jgi:hypothetical protein